MLCSQKARLSAGSIKQAETQSQTAAKTPPLSLHASQVERLSLVVPSVSIIIIMIKGLFSYYFKYLPLLFGICYLQTAASVRAGRKDKESLSSL